MRFVTVHVIIPPKPGIASGFINSAPVVVETS